MALENQSDTCPQCLGSGFIFKKTDRDHRIQATCAGCGGSGKLTDNLAAKLSGENEGLRIKVANEMEAKERKLKGWW